MNRRGFLKLLGLASAGSVVGSKLLSHPVANTILKLPQGKTGDMLVVDSSGEYQWTATTTLNELYKEHYGYELIQHMVYQDNPFLKLKST